MNRIIIISLILVLAVGVGLVAHLVGGPTWGF